MAPKLSVASDNTKHSLHIKGIICDPDYYISSFYQLYCIESYFHYEIKMQKLILLMLKLILAFLLQYKFYGKYHQTVKIKTHENFICEYFIAVKKPAIWYMYVIHSCYILIAYIYWCCSVPQVPWVSSTL